MHMLSYKCQIIAWQISTFPTVVVAMSAFLQWPSSTTTLMHQKGTIDNRTRSVDPKWWRFCQVAGFFFHANSRNSGRKYRWKWRRGYCGQNMFDQNYVGMTFRGAPVSFAHLHTRVAYGNRSSWPTQQQVLKIYNGQTDRCSKRNHYYYDVHHYINC